MEREVAYRLRQLEKKIKTALCCNTGDSGGGSGTIDAVPTDGSSNAVSSNGVFDALAGKQNTLTNPVTGTGTVGRVAYWSSGSAITSDADLTFDGTQASITASANTAYGLKGLRLNDTFNGGSVVLQTLAGNNALYITTTAGAAAMVSAAGFNNPNDGNQFQFNSGEWYFNNGNLRANSLAGVGNRMVIAGSTGILSTQAIPSGGSATPGGSTTQVQFNNAGAFGGSPNMYWDNTNNQLVIGDEVPDQTIFKLQVGKTGVAGRVKFISNDDYNLLLQNGGGRVYVGSTVGSELVFSTLAGTMFGKVSPSLLQFATLVGTGTRGLQVQADGTVIAGSETGVVASRTVAGNTTLLTTDNILRVDASGGPITVTFPASVSVGKSFRIKKIDTTSNPVNFAGATIDGDAAAYIANPLQGVILYASGATAYDVF